MRKENNRLHRVEKNNFERRRKGATNQGEESVGRSENAQTGEIFLVPNLRRDEGEIECCMYFEGALRFSTENMLVKD